MIVFKRYDTVSWMKIIEMQSIMDKNKTTFAKVLKKYNNTPMMKIVINTPKKSSLGLCDDVDTA